jgi:hypothetical protein
MVREEEKGIFSNETVFGLRKWSKFVVVVLKKGKESSKECKS